MKSAQTVLEQADVIEVVVGVASSSLAKMEKSKSCADTIFVNESNTRRPGRTMMTASIGKVGYGLRGSGRTCFRRQTTTDTTLSTYSKGLCSEVTVYTLLHSSCRLFNLD